MHRLLQTILNWDFKKVFMNLPIHQNPWIKYFENKFIISLIEQALAYLTTQEKSAFYITVWVRIFIFVCKSVNLTFFEAFCEC